MKLETSVSVDAPMGVVVEKDAAVRACVKKDTAAEAMVKRIASFGLIR